MTNRSLRTLALALAVATATSFPCLPARAAAADEDRTGQAQRHFRRGVELYEEGNPNAAYVEFSRAYELAPRPQLLFNLGQVAFETQDYATALGHFRAYASAGDDNVTPERRAQVQAEIAKLEKRVALLEVTGAAPGAEVLVNDVLVGTLPLAAPVTVNVGRVKVTLNARNGRSSTRVFDATGGARLVARFASESPRPGAASAAEAVPTAGATPSPGTQGLSTGAWVAWGLSGVLLAGAATTGALAYRSSEDLADLRARYPASPSALDDKESQTKTLSLVADGLLVGAVVSALVAIVASTGDTPERARRAESRHRPTLSFHQRGFSLQGGF
ncbi:MAG: hypothetical protein KA712_24255 [Myxococcales bacterium]|nr:hypothetical protein [Myxococcales bacterium]